jgi:hypothetical protein
MTVNVVPFATAQDRKARAAIDAFAIAFARELPKINPRMTKHEFAAILAAVADEFKNWSADIYSGQDGPMGE